MSNYSMDCIPNLPLSLNLTAIAACQSAATTPFCWPPNGTRICAPSRNIPFYWPPTYYHPDSKVAIDYDISSRYLFLLNNTGNRNQSFTSYMYDDEAISIRGQSNEKSMKLYMRERRFGDDVQDKFNLAVHDGPTVILVKTAAFSTTVRSARATATSRPYRSGSNSDDDDGPNLSSGAIAGIVLASIFSFIVLMTCCIKGCCGCGKQPRPAKPKMTKEEQQRIAQEGMELMAQRNAAGVQEMEEGRRLMGDVPPPKYTP